MKINELVTPSLGKPAAAKPPGTMNKVMNKFASAAGAVKTGVQAANTAVNKFMTAPKDSDSFASKLGGAISSLNKGKGVKDIKSRITPAELNQFASLLMQADIEEPEVVEPIKKLLANPSDLASKKTIISHIDKLLADKRYDISHADFNSEYRGILDKLNIKPTDFKEPAGKGTSNILQPSGKPF